MYGPHPSTELNKLFRERPYQGQDPQKAKVIIVGIDANFRSDVETYGQFFEKLESYLKNGVTFWKEYSILHPFLLYKMAPSFFRLEDYPLRQNRDGVPYHKYFGEINLPVDCTECISFVELLGVPTVGNTEEIEFWKLFKLEHARLVDTKINSNPPKLIFLSKSVIDKMRTAKKDEKNHGIFWWVPDNDERSLSGESKIIKLTTVLDDRGYEVYKIPHFSSFVYIKKEKRMEILNKIHNLILNFCGK
jgi:hypothetical protein